MAWVKLTDGFPEDPRIEALSDKAFRLHVTALCYCARNLTDGRVTPKALTLSSIVAGTRNATAAANELVLNGLWEPNGTGHVIPKYLEYNPSAQDVKEERRKARDRMRNKRGDA